MMDKKIAKFKSYSKHVVSSSYMYMRFKKEGVNHNCHRESRFMDETYIFIRVCIRIC